MASFIQEDLHFLQSRAKIWLEEVIQEPLPTDKSLSAILADGQILSRVAATIGKLVRSPSERSDGLKSRASGSSGSPSRAATGWSCLANVEVFLKMCKDIGVPSRDLFSSTDVVQEKDIKRVCLCFRVLAKKARAANPSVPSFDDASSVPVQIRSRGRVESAKKDLLESAAASEKSITVDVDVSVGKVAIPELLKEQVSNHQVVDFGKHGRLPASTDSSGKKEARWSKDNEVAKAPFNDEKTRRGSLWAVIGFGVVFIIGSGTFLFTKRQRYQTYRVKEGDTLYDISKKTRVENWRKLHQSNPQLINPDLIFPEQTIRLKQ